MTLHVIQRGKDTWMARIECDFDWETFALWLHAWATDQGKPEHFAYKASQDNPDHLYPLVVETQYGPVPDSARPHDAPYYGFRDLFKVTAFDISQLSEEVTAIQRNGVR